MKFDKTLHVGSPNIGSREQFDKYVDVFFSVTEEVAERLLVLPTGTSVDDSKIKQIGKFMKDE